MKVQFIQLLISKRNKETLVIVIFLPLNIKSGKNVKFRLAPRKLQKEVEVIVNKPHTRDIYFCSLRKFGNLKGLKKSIINIIDQSSSIDDCFNKIKNITKRDINTTERRTIQQTEIDDWFHCRKGVITGTSVFQIQ